MPPASLPARREELRPSSTRSGGMSLARPLKAHGSVECAVFSFRGIRSDAVDDELCRIEAGFVRVFALGDRLGSLSS